MKRIHLLTFLLIAFTSLQGIAQCNETHNLCKKHLSKEDKKAGWFTNQQSVSFAEEKGEEYVYEIMAYKGYEYRLSVCADIDGGIPVNFKLAQDVMEPVTDADGNTTIEKKRKVIFDNSKDELGELYVLYQSAKKNEKFYLSFIVPASGKSTAKKLKSPDKVCLGILIEHRRTKGSSL